jgi:hypothetical protein
MRKRSNRVVDIGTPTTIDGRFMQKQVYLFPYKYRTENPTEYHIMSEIDAGNGATDRNTLLAEYWAQYFTRPLANRKDKFSFFRDDIDISRKIKIFNTVYQPTNVKYHVSESYCDVEAIIIKSA